MSKITREEVLKIGDKLKPILQNRIEYIDNLQEIDCFSKDSREWKEAKDVLKIINFITQPPQLDSNIEELKERAEEALRCIQLNTYHIKHIADLRDFINGSVQHIQALKYVEYQADCNYKEVIKYRNTIKEVIELLSKSGINSKELAIKKLKENK